MSEYYCADNQLYVTPTKTECEAACFKKKNTKAIFHNPQPCPDMTCAVAMHPVQGLSMLSFRGYVENNVLYPCCVLPIGYDRTKKNIDYRMYVVPITLHKSVLGRAFAIVSTWVTRNSTRDDVFLEWTKAYGRDFRDMGNKVSLDTRVHQLHYSLKSKGTNFSLTTQFRFLMGRFAEHPETDYQIMLFSGPLEAKAVLDEPRNQHVVDLWNRAMADGTELAHFPHVNLRAIFMVLSMRTHVHGKNTSVVPLCVLLDAILTIMFDDTDVFCGICSTMLRTRKWEMIAKAGVLSSLRAKHGLCKYGNVNEISYIKDTARDLDLVLREKTPKIVYSSPDFLSCFTVVDMLKGQKKSICIVLLDHSVSSVRQEAIREKYAQDKSITVCLLGEEDHVDSDIVFLFPAMFIRGRDYGALVSLMEAHNTSSVYFSGAGLYARPYSFFDVFLSPVSARNKGMGVKPYVAGEKNARRGINAPKKLTPGPGAQWEDYVTRGTKRKNEEEEEESAYPYVDAESMNMQYDRVCVSMDEPKWVIAAAFYLAIDQVEFCTGEARYSEYGIKW